jgi:hypothetical protein
VFYFPNTLWSGFFPILFLMALQFEIFYVPRFSSFRCDHIAIIALPYLGALLAIDRSHLQHLPRGHIAQVCIPYNQRTSKSSIIR